MKGLIKFIYNKIFSTNSSQILEMATIGNPVLDKSEYLVAVHGLNSGERIRPNFHIYGFRPPYKEFNFEIALDEIICRDEINIIKMLDKKNHKNISNMNKCPWNNYHKLKNDFEDWLFSKSSKRGDFIDNLDTIIYSYNEELSLSHHNNPLLEYIREHSMKVMKKYWKYFSEEDKKLYKECFI